MPTRIILAPMAGITDLAYRTLCRRFGVKFAFTEMLCVNAMVYNNPQSHELIRSNAVDRPLGLQILAAAGEDIPQALDKAQGLKYELLDVNAACPQKKVTAKARGAFLLTDMSLLKKVLTMAVKYSAVPVTVKLRLGWNDAAAAVDIARHAEDCGVKAIFVHGRTRSQFYHGQVNYQALAAVKKAVTVPVVASGDILSAALAKKMREETGCDALLVARGAMGNPWLFKEIETYLRTGKIPSRPTPRRIAFTMKRHLSLLTKLYGDESGLAQFKKFFVRYVHGFPGVRPLRARAVVATRVEAIRTLIEHFANS